MTPTSHVIASVATSAVFGALTHSFEGTLACFLSGILIDIDHHFDLWIYRKKFLLHIKHIHEFCEKEKSGKLYLIFHSYELLAIFWVCVIFLHLNRIWWGIAIGLSVHLLLDQVGNKLKPGAYFLWYRIKNNFSKESVFPLGYFQRTNRNIFP